MADWNLPVASSLYVDVLNYLKARDVDALTQCFTVPTNIPEHTIEWNRTWNLFREWVGGVWTNKVISLYGGGTGAGDAGNARINLGLGSMAVQSASNVAITGGSITNINPLTASNVTLFGGNITGMTEIQGLNVRATAGGYLVGDGYYISNIRGSQIASEIINTARLGTGVANNTSYLRGDSTWQVITTPRWTSYYMYDHGYVSVAQVNGFSLINCHNTAPMNLHIPYPNATNFPAGPYGALRIMTWYGNVSVYGGYPVEGYGEIGGRPAPFVMNVPKMSIDVIPDPPTTTWNVF